MLESAEGGTKHLGVGRLMEGYLPSQIPRRIGIPTESGLRLRLKNDKKGAFPRLADDRRSFHVRVKREDYELVRRF